MCSLMGSTKNEADIISTAGYSFLFFEGGTGGQRAPPNITKTSVIFSMRGRADTLQGCILP